MKKNENTQKTPKSEMKTFRLSRHSIDVIEKLSHKFSESSKIKISMGKIIELAIFNIENASLEDLLNC